MDVGPQLAALADPTRRTIFELIHHGPLSVREVTERMPISQPAVSQHLAVLRKADLATFETRGASTIYRADNAGLAKVGLWLESMWDDVLDAFVDAAQDLELDTKENR